MVKLGEILLSGLEGARKIEGWTGQRGVDEQVDTAAILQCRPAEGTALAVLWTALRVPVSRACDSPSTSTSSVIHHLAPDHELLITCMMVSDGRSPHGHLRTPRGCCSKSKVRRAAAAAAPRGSPIELHGMCSLRQNQPRSNREVLILGPSVPLVLNLASVQTSSRQREGQGFVSCPHTLPSSYAGANHPFLLSLLLSVAPKC